MIKNFEKTYAVSLNGCCPVFTVGTSPEEVEADFRKELHEELILEPVEMVVEELAPYPVEVVNMCPDSDEVAFVKACLEAVPTGYRDPLDDYENLTYEGVFTYKGFRPAFRFIAFVQNWKPDYSFDPDGEYGSFDVVKVLIIGRC